jgi:hypothetical protein
MKFENLNAELVLDDKKDLLSITAKLTFENDEGSEINKLLPVYFQGSKGIFFGSDPRITYTTKIALNDTGKKTLKSLLKSLNELDAAYATRTATVNDFMNLLSE